MWSKLSISGASLASRSPYGRNTTKADIYISANDFGIYPSAQGKYPKKITEPIVLETGDCSIVLWYDIVLFYFGLDGFSAS